MPTNEQTNNDSSFDEVGVISAYNELTNVVNTARDSGVMDICQCSICGKYITDNSCYSNHEVYNGLSFIRWPFPSCVGLDDYSVGRHIGCTCHFSYNNTIRICWYCFASISGAYYRNVNSSIYIFLDATRTSHNDDSHCVANSLNAIAPRSDDDYDDENPSCRYCDRNDSSVTTHEDTWGHNIYLCERCERNGNHLIHDYTYEPELTFYETIKDKRTELFYGIELEVEVLPDFRIPDVIRKLPDFTYVKSDSSIRRGFEIVTHPATYNWLLEHIDDWNNILDIRNYGCRSYNTQTCGMHIHMSEAAFGRHHLYKYLYFMYNPVNKTAITQISQREDYLLDRWSGFNNDLRMIKAKAITRAEVGDRHTAVGLGRMNTVELRIFRGTLNPVGFWKNIEFAHALYNFTKDNGLKSMIWIMFIEYVKTNKRDYPNLNKFLFSEQTEIILNY